MKTIINFILSFAVLFLASVIAPTYIVAENWKTAMLASAVCAAIEVLIFIFIFVSLAVLSHISWETGSYCLEKIVNIVAIIEIGLYIISTPIVLYITQKLIDNFQINGIFTYIVLSIILSIFQISNSQNKNNGDNARKTM